MREVFEGRGRPHFNFTIFDYDPSRSRKGNFALGASVVIFDNDGEGIGPEEFPGLFDAQKMIVLQKSAT